MWPKQGFQTGWIRANNGSRINAGIVSVGNLVIGVPLNKCVCINRTASITGKKPND